MMKRRLSCVFLALVAVVISASAGSAGAADAVVTRHSELRAERFVDAPAIRSLDEGARVDIVKTEAGWVQVRSNGVTGWLRATSLAGEGAAKSALAALESGRSAPGNLVVAAGIRRIPKASRIALIVGVDAVAIEGRPPLRWPGVAADIESARAMSRRFAIPDDNIEIVRGADATLRGMTEAFDRLAQRTQPGDQVFIYFSGPGTLVSDVVANGCGPAWVTADGRSLSAQALAAQLKPVLATAEKTFVVSDAAFAAASEVTAASSRGWARKHVALPATARCASSPGEPAMSLAEAAVAAGAPAANIVHLQSAPGPFQGADQSTTGGVFTQVLADCILGDATDSDGSGSVTVSEIEDCANRWRPRAAGGGPAPDTTPRIAAATGNAGFSPLQGVVDSPLATSSRVPDGAPVIAAPPGSAPAAKASARAAIADVLAQGDGRIRVQLTATPPALQIGRDYLDLQLTSSHDGFAYLILLGSDEKTFYLLFPNALDRDNRIAAGQTLQLPRPSWRIQSQGPAGRDVVLVVVAEAQRDLTSIAREKSGPFTTVLTDALGRAQLQWLLGRSGIAETQTCVGSGHQRNLAAVKVCSDAFGATRIEVIER
jgi:hypothetical protein